MTPIFTQEQFQALSDAIAQGTRVVKYADKTVEYRSLAEMMSILRLMQTQLCPPDPCHNSGRKFAEFDKGVY